MTLGRRQEIGLDGCISRSWQTFLEAVLDAAYERLSRIERNQRGDTLASFQEGSGSPDKYRKYYDGENQVFKSETGELTLMSDAGILQINAPKVQGVVGFIKDREFDFPLFTAKVSNTHASVLVISRDNKPLAESKHFYLAVVGPSKMTGQQFNHSRTALKKLGSLPVLQQVINGTVEFKNRTKKSKMQVLPLAPNGSAGKPMALKKSKNGLVLDLGKGRTFV